MKEQKYQLNDLIYDIELGGEIEFNIKGHNYFLQPFYADPDYQKPGYILKLTIYDCGDNEKPHKLVCGTVEEILNYTFPEGITLNQQFDQFTFDYIL